MLRLRTLVLAAMRQVTLQPKQVLANASEAPFVLDVQFLNFIPQFPVGIVIRAHVSSYIKSAQ